jgi:DNA-binding winged helix-turn-helix (wHTH) protein
VEPVKTSEHSNFTVGPWTVEPDRLRICRDGQRIVLQPRVMGLLQHLAARHGEVVNHEELVRAVWEGRVVEDGAVYQTLAKLRKALGDDAHQPRYVETIPTKGYRLIAPVGTPEPADSTGAPETGESLRTAEARRSGWVLLGLIILVALTAGVFALLMR